MKKILTLDGGGMAGLIAARILHRIDLERSRFNVTVFGGSFDLIAGTSTGAILAAALAKPNPYLPGQLIGFYETAGPKIFSRTLGQRLTTLGGITGAKYRPDTLQSVLADYFGPATLGECRTELLVPTYDLAAGQPYFFKRHQVLADAQKDSLLADLTRAATAAPTFFPPLCWDDGRVLVDGGVLANNPAMCAYAEARRLWGPDEELFILSVGTGNADRRASCRQATGWGLLDWARQIPNVFLDGTVDVADYQLRWMDTRRGLQYVRLQPENLALLGPMDDTSADNLQYMAAVVDNFCDDHDALLTKIAEVIDA